MSYEVATPSPGPPVRHGIGPLWLDFTTCAGRIVFNYRTRSGVYDSRVRAAAPPRRLYTKP